ncbi:methyltransferase domain-containing protein [bacterium]|nr:methyltransferase domain-containing protein [bacterium]
MKRYVQNWKVKALTQKALWALPGGIYLNAAVSKLRAGHSAEAELLRKHAPNYLRHMAALRRHGFEISGEKTFLEIGTGWDVNVAFLARLTGFGRVVTVDAFRHLQTKQIEACVKLFPQLAGELCTSFSLDEESLRRKIDEGSRISGEEFCGWAGIEYIAPISREYGEIETGTCDVVYSTAVFEHIYVADVIETLKQIHRVLKPGGVTTHVIDLKDHFAYYQPGLPYNHFLRFSESEWMKWAGNPMSFTNRLLASDWERLFRDSGLDVVQFEEVIETSLPEMDKGLLHEDFRHRSERDLRVGELHVIARKPQ